MNVLLVYPKYPDTFWSFKTVLKYISKKAAFPPLGLLTVAAMLPADWNTRLVDVNVRPLKDEDIEWCDMVFIGAMIVQLDDARTVVDRAKAAGKIVVAGGPVFTTMSERFEGVDHFVLNEAEVTLPPFLEDFQRGEAKRVYSSEEKPDIRTTPLPRWDLISSKDYATMSVQYSRGCPFNCEFCDIIVMNGRTPRTKSPEQMIAEFEALYKAGWRSGVFIVDDNFIGNKAEVKRMLPRLIEWQKEHRYPFQFLTEASTNLAEDQELMTLMSEANFHKVFLGIETPELDSLKECGKYQNTTRDLAESVRIIQRNGMQVMGGFIVGFDNDTESTFEAQMRFIQQVGIVTAMVGMLTALPRTRLWRRLHQENRLIEDTGGENTDAKINFIPRMDKDVLIRGYQNLVGQIYSRRLYYKRIDVFLKNYAPTVKSRLSYEDLRAFFLINLRVGCFSRSSLLYWRLLLKTMFTNFKALPAVVELAIFGLHFEKVVKRIKRVEIS